MAMSKCIFCPEHQFTCWPDAAAVWPQAVSREQPSGSEYFRKLDFTVSSQGQVQLVPALNCALPPQSTRMAVHALPVVAEKSPLMALTKSVPWAQLFMQSGPGPSGGLLQSPPQPSNGTMRYSGKTRRTPASRYDAARRSSLMSTQALPEHATGPPSLVPVTWEG